MSFKKIFMIGAILTVLCHALPGAAAPGAKFSYRPNELERLRQMQEAFVKIRQMMKRSCNDQSVIGELNKFAESSIKKYMLHLLIEDIRHHGKLLRIMNNDRAAFSGAKENKFVIDGMKYGTSCWNCRGAKKCLFCRGTGRCPDCKGSGSIKFASKTEACKQCYGRGSCPKCHGNPESHPCDTCGGFGMYCNLNKVKNRQRLLFVNIMGTPLSDAFKCNYLGTLYMNGLDGFPKDEERARIFFEMADRKGYLRGELQLLKKIYELPRKIALLRMLAVESPTRPGYSEVKNTLADCLHNIVVSEVKMAKQEKSYGEAIGVLENIIRNYSDADNIATAKTILEEYRCRYIAHEMARAERSSHSSYRTAVSIMNNAIQRCPEASNIAEAKEKLQLYRQKYIEEQRMLRRKVNELLLRFYNSTSDSMYLTADALNLISPFAMEARSLMEKTDSLDEYKEAVLNKICLIDTNLELAATWEGLSDRTSRSAEMAATRLLRDVRGDIMKINNANGL